MTEETSRLALPLLMPSQAQKHLTHNEALLALDALVHLAARDRAAAPPAAPVEGDRLLVAASASGEFAGHGGEIALRQGEAWQFLKPRAGWALWLESERLGLVHDGTAWRDAVLRRAERLGIGETRAASGDNRLEVASRAVLFDHEGDHSRVAINKAKAGDTASLVFQTNYSGRAEIGLAGDEALSVKVSADGATWRQALFVEPGTGRLGLGTTNPTAPLDVAGPVRVGRYAKAALPDAAATGAGAVIFVSDEVGGAVLAFSDGAAWRRVTDRATLG
ncbi:hypothetical protein GCM10011390_15500 [Aureimonas endophytica]|uniref:DUF2793 domain-containing protein n=1 Tax=Aureimonas endophytica TaxID=2027858 RepID=A0A917E2X9_9HYPH|nr:DUF2793 domain-containing protein [Aureimonas endophytica]GGD97634.1 hypothetical protein GCM10011390_15500 [Aureimonas endophytica]